jgi:hypothetical protein
MDAIARRFNGFLVFVVLTMPIGLAAAQDQPSSIEVDPVIGSWQLDVAASAFDPGPPPKSEFRLYEAEHEGIKATVVTTYADGRTTTFEYVTSFNDVTSAVTGSGTSDAVRMRKVDTNTAEADLFLGGQVVGQTRRVISTDGQTMTITLKRSAPVAVSNVTVYRRR